MAVIGFNYTKMLVEKKAPAPREIGVEFSLIIKDITKAKLNLKDKKQGGLRYTFEYRVKYKPDIASIVLTGTIVDIQDLKATQIIMKKWEKGQELDLEKMVGVYNAALNSCRIQAIVLSKEIGIPSPLKPLIGQPVKKKA